MIKRLTGVLAAAGMLAALTAMPSLAQDKMHGDKTDKAHKGKMTGKTMKGKMSKGKMSKGMTKGKMSKGKPAGDKMDKMHKDKK